VDQAAEVATYREVVELPATQPVVHAPGRALGLRDALLLANRHNEDLNIEGEAYLRSIVDRRRAVANFLPTVDLVPSYTRRDFEPTAGVGSGGGGKDNFDVTLGIDYTLFEGFRNVNAYWRDTFTIRQQRNRLLDAQELLLLDVARVYYQILRSEASVRVLENSVAVQAERLRDSRSRLAVGFARPLDVAQTEAQLAETRTRLTTARNDANNGRALLAFLTASPVEASPLVDAFELPAEVEELAVFLSRAAAMRSDVAAAAAAVTAARYDVDVAFGQYYPSVTLNVAGLLYQEDVPDEREWTGILRANIPLFSAGRIRADVREAWSFFREALLVHNRLERQVAQQVQTAYQDLAASEARLVDLQVQLEAAQQAFTQAERTYQVGQATNLDRIQAQDALLEAQLALSSEQFDRKLFYLALVRESGMFREALEAALAGPAVAVEPAAEPTTAPRGPLLLRPVTRPATQPALPGRLR
jgi:outer membrane protein